MDGVLYNADATTLISCPGGVAEVTIPSSVTVIGEAAFEYCRELTQIKIPDSVKEIGNDAFYGCSKLTSLTLGAGLTKIGESAFYNCEELASVTSKNPVPPVVTSWTFESVNKSTCLLFVPVGSLEAYSTADGWKEFVNISESEEAGVDQIIPETGEKYDVYNLQGVLVLSKVSKSALQTLSSGMYVINGKKVMIR